MSFLGRLLPGFTPAGGSSRMTLVWGRQSLARTYTSYPTQETTFSQRTGAPARYSPQGGANAAYNFPKPSSSGYGFTDNTRYARNAFGANPFDGGRSVSVIRNQTDLAYNILGRIVRDNGIRKELRQRQRHEKPNYKRRRLKSERFRKVFARVIASKVALVMRMKKLGF